MLKSLEGKSLPASLTLLSEDIGRAFTDCSNCEAEPEFIGTFRALSVGNREMASEQASPGSCV